MENFDHTEFKKKLVQLEENQKSPIKDINITVSQRMKRMMCGDAGMGLADPTCIHQNKCLF
jgi:hypothetical protein